MGNFVRDSLNRIKEQVGDGLFLLFVNDPRPAEQRLENIKARLDRVPEFLEAYGDGLRRPRKEIDDEISGVLGSRFCFHRLGYLSCSQFSKCGKN